MNKIRKFNESNQKELDIEYLNFIFEHFIDNDIYNSQVFFDEKKEVYEIYIDEPPIRTIDIDFEIYQKNFKEIESFSNELKACIDRVKEEYPDIKVLFEIENFIIPNARGKQENIKRDIKISFLWHQYRGI